MGEGAELRLLDSGLAARHARVERRNGDIWFKDLARTLEARYDAPGWATVREAELPLGLRVRLGDWRIWVASPRAPLRPAVGHLGPLVSIDQGMQHRFQLLEGAALGRRPLLLVGEPGSGQGGIARALHRRACAAGPFVELDCHGADAAALFGSPRREDLGAIARARGGTLLLRRLEALAAPLLQRLLAELAPLVRPDESTGLVELHLISTVSAEAPLGDRSARLHGLGEGITLPPLRFRRGDILFLWERFTAELGRPLVPSEATRTAMLLHRWPGNVAELRALARRAVETARGPVVGPELLDFETPGAVVQERA
ncbi:MAG: AAA-type ATPase lid domain-containing protein [Deltaproteobacteria bacterium]